MARSGAIEIPVAVDTGGVEKSIQNGLIDPIEDAEDALKKLGKVDAGKDIDRDLAKAQDATEDLDKELDQTRKSLDKLGYAAKEAGSDGKKGMDKIKDGASEVQSEIGQNLGETVSSFRGDLSDLGQVGQDTLGGLAGTLANMGPAGALGAAGLGAVAAGVGVITDAFNKAKESADDAREAAFSFAYDTAGALEAAGYTERISQWTSDTEKLKQAQDIATGSGWAVVDVVDALASGGDKLTALGDAFAKNAEFTNVSIGRTLELNGVLDGTAEGYVSGAAGAELAAKANFEYAKAVGVATGETDDLGNAIVRLPDGKELVVNAKTGQAFEALDALENKNLTPKTLEVRANMQPYLTTLSAELSKNRTVTIMPRLGQKLPI